MLAGLRAGWRIVRASGWMLPSLPALVAYSVFVLPSVFVLGPAIAESDLDGATSWAAIVTAFGIGAVAGSVLAMRLKPRRTLVRGFAAMVRRLAAGGDPRERARDRRDRGLELLAGIGVSLFFTLWETTIQEQIPPEATARVAAYDWATSVGLMPVGLALAGPIVERARRRDDDALGDGAGHRGRGARGLSVPAVRRVRRPAAVGRRRLRPADVAERPCAVGRHRVRHPAHASDPGLRPAEVLARGVAHLARRRARCRRARSP